MDIWQLIGALTKDAQLSRGVVETLLGTRLTEKRRSTYTVFFEAGNVSLADGIVLDKIDFRQSTEQAAPGFLVLETRGTCIPLEQVKNHYQHLEITGIPRGHSLDEATSHTAVTGWGKISFGFAERNPNCLAWIAIEPKNPS